MERSGFAARTGVLNSTKTAKTKSMALTHGANK
jgi:hypothetical protein